MNADLDLDQGINFINLKGIQVNQSVVWGNSKAGQINLLHQNICSIRNKKQNLESILNQNSIDICCISEHWLDSNEMLLCQLQNYYLAAEYSRKKFRGGGTCIYVKNDIVCKKIDIANMCQDKLLEACCITVSSLELCIIVLYRSPNASNLNDFFFSLELILKKTMLCQKFKIVCGDFNINFMSDSVHSKFIRNMFKQYNLHCTISENTRITCTTSTLIDNIATNIPYDSYTTLNSETAISDHLAQVFIINMSKIKHIKNEKRVKYTKKRMITNENIKKFKNILITETWEEALTENNPNVAWNNFSNTFFRHFNHCFPLISRKCYDTSKLKWLTKGLITSGQKLRDMRQKLRINKDITLRTYYKQYEKLYNKLLKISKKQYNGKKIATSINKTKAMWAVINKELKPTHGYDNIALNINGIKIVNSRDIANSFNDYFIKSPLKLQSEIKTIGNTSKVNSINSNSLFFSPVTEEEVIKIINKLKSKNSYGLDEVPITLVKKCSDLIVHPLSHIFNECLAQGIFPDRLKYAKIVPIHKKGKKTLLGNYRPIALLSSFSKILEKIIAIKLIKFLTKNKIISRYQFGFVEGRSTEHAIFSFIDKLLRTLDKKQLSMGIFADLTKAFDCVDHKLLLEKLEQYGVRGITNHLFKSFLENRKQVTVIKHCVNNEISTILSDIGLTQVGVPQGSILGPLLFIIFINDFPESISTGSAIMFADDTNILVTSPNKVTLEENTRQAITDMTRWFQNNKLVLNVNKSALINFTITNKGKQQSIENNKLDSGIGKLQPVHNIRFLGLIVDRNLTWNEHLDKICNKLSSLCFAVYTLKNICSYNTVLSYYFSNVHSIINYGIIFWGKSSNWKKVFRLQKKIVRIINHKDARTHCRPLFKENKIMTLPSLYMYRSILFYMENIEYVKNSDIHKYSTRNANNIHQISHNTKKYTLNPSYSGAKLLNHLPVHLKIIGHHQKFKRYLKSYFLNTAFYSVEEYLEGPK